VISLSTLLQKGAEGGGGGANITGSDLVISRHTHPYTFRLEASDSLEHTNVEPHAIEGKEREDRSSTSNGGLKWYTLHDFSDKATGQVSVGLRLSPAPHISKEEGARRRGEGAGVLPEISLDSVGWGSIDTQERGVGGEAKEETQETVEIQGGEVEEIEVVVVPGRRGGEGKKEKEEILSDMVKGVEIVVVAGRGMPKMDRYIYMCVLGYTRVYI